jgi:hypothetical protein
LPVNYGCDGSTSMRLAIIVSYNDSRACSRGHTARLPSGRDRGCWIQTSAVRGNRDSELAKRVDRAFEVREPLTVSGVNA